MRKISGRFGAVARTTVLMGMMLAAAIAAPAQTFTSLFSFDNTDGANPYAAMVQGTDGNLYGTTYYGGTGRWGTAVGWGTIFRISPDGNLTTLYSFCSQTNCTDGGNPIAGLVQAADGGLYGTTSEGGANSGGTVFKISLTGMLTTLYSFCSQPGCLDGLLSSAGLVKAPNDSFYGTTRAGGGNGNGTVFKITRSGTLTTLYSFCSQGGCADGSRPLAGLVLATDGNFYGTTSGNGAGNAGTVFKISPGGTLKTLYSFCSQNGCVDGKYPETAVIQDSNGSLYGTTVAGGAGNGGTVFKITPGGALTTLYSFCSQSGCADGESPVGLIQATDGNFYGTTDLGGGYIQGSIFKISPQGALTTLYSFCSQSGCTDGSNPHGALVQDTNGNLYATTNSGGSGTACDAGCGTVFSLSVGLQPFVETQPTFGKVGKVITILGTSLTGTTSVTFNGTAATFTVELPTGIEATVPAGASSGPVQVVTPSGTLTSNVNFQVEP
jgi:uncharacterized repeat protein (TIGR03803 family)